MKLKVKPIKRYYDRELKRVVDEKTEAFVVTEERGEHLVRMKACEVVDRL